MVQEGRVVAEPQQSEMSVEINQVPGEQRDHHSAPTSCVLNSGAEQGGNVLPPAMPRRPGNIDCTIAAPSWHAQVELKRRTIKRQSPGQSAPRYILSASAEVLKERSSGMGNSGLKRKAPHSWHIAYER